MKALTMNAGPAATGVAPMTYRVTEAATQPATAAATARAGFSLPARPAAFRTTSATISTVTPFTMNTGIRTSQASTMSRPPLPTIPIWGASIDSSEDRAQNARTSANALHESPSISAGVCLHLAEAMGIGVTDDEQLVPALQAHLGAASQVAHHAGDGVNVDDGRTMNLPEGGRVELVAKLFDGLADQRFLRGGDHPRVLAVGLEITHVVHGDDAHRRTVRRVDPAQKAAPRRAELAQQPFDRRRGPADALLPARHGRGEPGRIGGLEQVVRRALLERGQRVLVVCRHKHDMAAAAQLPRHIEAGEARHLMSRNSTSGACVSTSRSVAMPSPVWATMSSSGQSAPSSSASSSRSSGSSSAMMARGLGTSLRRLCSHPASAVGSRSAWQPAERQSVLGVGQFWLATVWFAGRSCLLAVMTMRSICCCDASSRPAPSTIAAFTANRPVPFTAIATPSATRRIPRFMEYLPPLTRTH